MTMTTTHPLSRRYFETGLGIPFTEQNTIRRLRNGCEIFPAMLDAIANPTETIEFLTFVYWQGDIADKFANALAERARAGVRVYVLLDAVGAHPMKKQLIRVMSGAGVEVKWFREVKMWKTWRLDHRTHRKVMVCDGTVAYTGGVGIAEEWTGDARNPEEWRETHFEIKGPAVDGLRSAFFENWAETCRPNLVEFTPTEGQEHCGSAAIQTIRTSASFEWGDAAPVLHMLLASAQSSLSITTAYFVPDESTIRRLITAKSKGVDIRILVPGEHMDIRLCRLGGQAHYERLLDRGIEIYEYQPTMIHAKLIMVDDEFSAIGSANFDYRSLFINDEVILIVHDERLTRDLLSDFDEDLQRARRITRKNWRKRGWWQRTKENIVRRVKHKL